MASPDEMAQRASEILIGMRWTWSKTRIQLCRARWRSSRSRSGSRRRGAAEGSINVRRARASTDLPLAAGPRRTRTGYGPVGRRAALSQVKTRIRAVVDRLKSAARPDRGLGIRGWGLGSASMPGEWRKDWRRLLVMVQP